MTSDNLPNNNNSLVLRKIPSQLEMCGPPTQEEFGNGSGRV